MTTLLPAVLSISAFLIAITFHEFCHALAAYKLGDSTAQRMGRLTLNPLSHIDPLGLLCMIFIGIGWARPVPMNPNNLKFPRFYSVLIGLAGPFSNFFLALLSLFILQYVPVNLTSSLYISLMPFFTLLARINIMLGLFNLLPIPPLDGSHLLRAVIPQNWESVYNTVQQISIIFLLILVSTTGFRKTFNKAMNRTLTLFQNIVSRA
ncbi:site-2 protease family protein [Candidatus Dependentiae bacterium]|nr:site-2 protease family protein [Candidatus Dependentiae bacterium]